MNFVVKCWVVTVRPRIAPVVAVVRAWRPRIRPRTLVVCGLVGAPALTAIGIIGYELVQGAWDVPRVAAPSEPVENVTKREVPIPAPGFTALLGGIGIFAWAVWSGRK